VSAEETRTAPVRVRIGGRLRPPYQDAIAPGTPVVLDLYTGQTRVPFGATATITDHAKECAFRFTRIEVAHADRWRIENVVIGTNSQFGPEFLTGSISAERINDVGLAYDVCAAKQVFVIVATYIGDVVDGEPFSCTVLGDACEEPSS
jgi:hypothetical protein